MQEYEKEILTDTRILRDEQYRLLTEGRVSLDSYLQAQKEFDDVIRDYLEALVYHRRCMLRLNVVMGQRILPRRKNDPIGKKSSRRPLSEGFLEVTIHLLSAAYAIVVGGLIEVDGANAVLFKPQLQFWSGSESQPPQEIVNSDKRSQDGQAGQHKRAKE